MTRFKKNEIVATAISNVASKMEELSKDALEDGKYYKDSVYSQDRYHLDCIESQIWEMLLEELVDFKVDSTEYYFEENVGDEGSDVNVG